MIIDLDRHNTLNDNATHVLQAYNRLTLKTLIILNATTDIYSKLILSN